MIAELFQILRASCPQPLLNDMAELGLSEMPGVMVGTMVTSGDYMLGPPSDVGVSQNKAKRNRGPNWTRTETLTLLTAYTAFANEYWLIQGRKCSLPAMVWEKIVRTVNDSGVPRNMDSCKNRMEDLKHAVRKLDVNPEDKIFKTYREYYPDVKKLMMDEISLSNGYPGEQSYVDGSDLIDPGSPVDSDSGNPQVMKMKAAWSKEETLQLLRMYDVINKDFIANGKDRILFWDTVAAVLAEKGVPRTPELCRLRFEDVRKHSKLLEMDPEHKGARNYKDFLAEMRRISGSPSAFTVKATKPAPQVYYSTPIQSGSSNFSIMSSAALNLHTMTTVPAVSSPIGPQFSGVGVGVGTLGVGGAVPCSSTASTNFVSIGDKRCMPLAAAAPNKRMRSMSEQSMPTQPSCWKEWSPEVVADWLARNRLEDHAHTFLQQRIGGDIIDFLSEMDLMALGLVTLGDRLRFKVALEKLAMSEQRQDGGEIHKHAMQLQHSQHPHDHAQPQQQLTQPQAHKRAMSSPCSSQDSQGMLPMQNHRMDYSPSSHSPQHHTYYSHHNSHSESPSKHEQQHDQMLPMSLPDDTQEHEHGQPCCSQDPSGSGVGGVDETVVLHADGDVESSSEGHSHSHSASLHTSL